MNLDWDCRVSVLFEYLSCLIFIYNYIYDIVLLCTKGKTYSTTLKRVVLSHMPTNIHNRHIAGFLPLSAKSWYHLTINVALVNTTAQCCEVYGLTVKLKPYNSLHAQGSYSRQFLAPPVAKGGNNGSPYLLVIE